MKNQKDHEMGLSADLWMVSGDGEGENTLIQSKNGGGGVGR